MEDIIVNFIRSNFETVNDSRFPEVRIYCPFCEGGENREFSFDINVEKGVARCWRAKCSWAGSFAAFLVKYLDIDYEDAKKILEGEEPKTSDELLGLINRLKVKIEEGSQELQGGSIEPFQSWVEGVTPVTSKNAPEWLLDWLRDVRGYEPERFLTDHSLFIPARHSRYDGRVIFRVTSDESLGFIAYSTKKDLTPKTLNPPGAILSKMLYNYNAVRNKKKIFICEGVFDSARLVSWNLPAVSLFGVAISAEQIGLLVRSQAKELIVCLDNGAEKKSFDIARQLVRSCPNKTVSVMILEGDGEDPDDLSEEIFMEYYFKRRKFQKESVENVLNDVNLLLDSYE